MAEKGNPFKDDNSVSNNDLDKNRLQENLDSIIQKYGSYTAHNIRLLEGVYTINNKANFDHFKLNRIKQILADYGVLQKGKKLLDIASLESMFAIEFAMEGLEVTSIEGRKGNLEKGKFVAKALSLKNMNFYLDDVNNITPEKFGEFDIILCTGILYHICKEKYLSFLKKVADCCKDLLIIDSFFSLHGNDYIEKDRVRYRGTTWREFEDTASKEEKEKNVHATLSDNFSFSMTKESLLKYLEILGFSSVCEVYLPSQPNNPMDRITLVCKKASSVSLKVFPEFSHKKHFESYVDTKGIGKKKIVHWNENVVKRILRRCYRITRYRLKKVLKKK